MRDEIDRRELFVKALAGLVGGAIGWIPVEITSHGHFLGEPISTFTVFIEMFGVALYAGVVGGMIRASESSAFEITPLTKRRFVTGFVLCLILGFVASYLSNAVFTELLDSAALSGNPRDHLISVWIARVFGFGFMGLMLGAGVGLAALSWPNISKGAIGGLIGGVLGGAAFDPIGSFSQSGLASRLIGFCVIGLAIGFFIGLVHQLTKSAWLAVEAGRLKGRQFRLDGPTITVGRAEENIVGLFGDPGVQPRHAVISHQGDSYTLKNLAVQAGTLVNGNRVEAVPLHEGDRVKISNYELTFHLRTQKRTPEPASVIVAPANPAYADGHIANSGTHVTDVAAIDGVATSGAFLVDASGHQFSLRPGEATRIGRALDNDIVVSDASVSRHHATIEYRNGGFVLRDLGSQNGTWVGVQRVTEVPLGRGDALRLGDALFTFHA